MRQRPGIPQLAQVFRCGAAHVGVRVVQGLDQQRHAGGGTDAPQDVDDELAQVVVRIAQVPAEGVHGGVPQPLQRLDRRIPEPGVVRGAQQLDQGFDRLGVQRPGGGENCHRLLPDAPALVPHGEKEEPTDLVEGVLSQGKHGKPPGLLVRRA